MKSCVYLIVFVTAFMAYLALADEAFLAKKPDNLKTCKLTDPNFKTCYAKGLEYVITLWKDGVPGLTQIGSLDPLYVDRISVVEDSNNPVAQIKLELLDVYLKGVTEMKILEATFDPQKYISKVKFAGSKLKIDCKYNMQGRILAIGLNGNGDCSMIIDDVEIVFSQRLKPRNEYGQIFIDIDKFRMEITKVGNFHTRMDNLFNGQPELTEATNTLINENWKTFYESLSPAIVRGLEEPIKNRLKAIYSYVPVTYFIEDFSV